MVTNNHRRIIVSEADILAQSSILSELKVVTAELKEQNKTIFNELKEIKTALRGNGKQGLCERMAVHDTCYEEMHGANNGEGKIDKIEKHETYFKLIIAAIGIILTILGGVIIELLRVKIL